MWVQGAIEPIRVSFSLYWYQLRSIIHSRGVGLAVPHTIYLPLVALGVVYASE
jgi:hypothetical protein